MPSALTTSLSLSADDLAECFTETAEASRKPGLFFFNGQNHIQSPILTISKYTAVLTTHTLLCKTSPEYLHLGKTTTPTEQQLPTPPSPGSHSTSFSKSLSNLDTSCEWNHTVFVFL